MKAPSGLIHFVCTDAPGYAARAAGEQPHRTSCGKEAADWPLVFERFERCPLWLDMVARRLSVCRKCVGVVQRQRKLGAAFLWELSK